MQLLPDLQKRIPSPASQSWFPLEAARPDLGGKVQIVDGFGKPLASATMVAARSR
jgi:hypothetical protein